MAPELSYDERVRLTVGVMRLLDEWQVGPADRVTLLGLPADTRPRTMDRYRQGTALPESEETMARVEHLIAIYDSLRTSFPHNPHMGMHWLSSPNRYLDDQIPLQVMLDEGLNGLQTIRGRLDCTVGWV